jgi:hypothetical protein
MMTPSKQSLRDREDKKVGKEVVLLHRKKTSIRN